MAQRWVALALFLLSACAQDFPRPETAGHPDSSPDGRQIFEWTFVAHGGDRLTALTDVNVSLEGDWPFLLPLIQPLLADDGYRVQSQERLLPNEAVYSVDYHGPAGQKRVLRTRSEIRVLYDGVESADEAVLQSTAVTADSYLFFLLGPLAMAPQADSFVRLEDGVEDGRRYFRIYSPLVPGVGLSERDELVVWVDAETLRTFRVHFTLEGYAPTRGAHVDVTFLDHVELDGYVLPTRFHERVLAPLAIDAHTWWLTGLDINRGLTLSDLGVDAWSARAARPATSINAPD